MALRILIAIPAYNEARTVRTVIQAVRVAVPKADILVVDDGSEDRTEEEARNGGAHVVRHCVNRGLGGAINTALFYARRHAYDAFVTIDADAQFSASDIPRLLSPIEKGNADVVFGSRFLQKNEIPFVRRLGNIVGNIVTRILFSVRVSDSQSGFRAFGRRAIEMMDITTNGMEVSSEIVKAVHDCALRVVEVPVHVTYTPYSLSKGQGFRRGLETLEKLILHKLRP